MLSRIRDKGEKPRWMKREVYEALCAYWSGDQWKKISERNKKNRGKSVVSGEGFPLHRGGSITHLVHRDRLQAKYGYDVGVAGTFLHTHATEVEGGKPQWVNTVAKDAHERFQKRWAEIEASHDPSSGVALPSEAEVWAEVNGGKKKSHIFGLAGEACFIGKKAAYTGSRMEEKVIEEKIEGLTRRFESRLTSVDNRITSENTETRSMISSLQTDMKMISLMLMGQLNAQPSQTSTHPQFQSIFSSYLSQQFQQGQPPVSVAVTAPVIAPSSAQVPSPAPSTFSAPVDYRGQIPCLVGFSGHYNPSISVAAPFPSLSSASPSTAAMFQTTPSGLACSVAPFVALAPGHPAAVSVFVAPPSGLTASVAPFTTPPSCATTSAPSKRVHSHHAVGISSKNKAVQSPAHSHFAEPYYVPEPPIGMAYRSPPHDASDDDDDSGDNGHDDDGEYDDGEDDDDGVDDM